MLLPYPSRAIIGLAGGVFCAGASYLAAGVWASPAPASWLQVAAITLLVHAILALATAGRAALWGRRVATACVAGGFAAALLIPADAPRVLGVPLGTVLMMTLVGVVPLVVLPLCFAHGFQVQNPGAGGRGAPRPVEAPAREPGDPQFVHGAPPREPA